LPLQRDFLPQELAQKDIVYKRVVKPKLWLAKQSDIAEQQWMATGAPSARARSLLAEAGSGGFSLITAPIETAGAVLLTKTFPVGSGANIYTGGTSLGVAVAPSAFIIGSAYLSPQDPVKGAAQLAGMSAVAVGVSKGLDLAGGKRIP